jgi:hypothetical protein
MMMMGNDDDDRPPWTSEAAPVLVMLTVFSAVSHVRVRMCGNRLTGPEPGFHAGLAAEAARGQGLR